MLNVESLVQQKVASLNYSAILHPELPETFHFLSFFIVCLFGLHPALLWVYCRP